ncbi:HEAT repeat domain-containing protein [Streptomyces sp. NRRL F-2664]|uniref:HEAT repeat domain-containing protein n=1 Tax=Streptomyces sp. NRRL F-2664 TaxID=1463842 RepID=UPI0004C9A957|nr:HEAT repeat domain-containing protein [Streptomyces sp. NRRL F-2664]
MTDRDARLAAAVRAGDLGEVHALLESGSNPDATDEDGLPVLCTAVAAFAHEVAEALVEAGANPDRELPDGTTPLLRAIEGGSPAVFEATLGSEPRLRLAPERREELLAAARGWYEEGPAARLRHLTADPDRVRAQAVREGEYSTLTEYTLGGRRVRDGHGGILTGLEWAFRILTPPAELVARAVRHGDPEHADRWASEWILSQRRSAETWAEVVAFHRHPDPLPRLFVIDVLVMHALTGASTQHVGWYDRERLKLLGTWVDVEDDAVVLARLLRALVDEGFPEAEAEAVGLRHAGHADARVRREVPGLFDRPLTPRAAEAVRALCRDPDADVRVAAAEALAGEALPAEDRPLLLALLADADPHVARRAAHGIAGGADRSPETTEALVRLLDAEDQDIRLSAAYGLALRDDPRTVEAYARVGRLDRPEYEHDHRTDGLWRWKLRNAPSP